MTPLRIALVAGGLLVAGGALFLLYRGLGAMGSDPAASGGAGAPPGTAASGAPALGEEKKDKDDKAPPPAWQSFLRRDDSATAVPRPLARLESPVASPFDAVPAVAAAPAPSGEAVREPARPALRLEGVAAGDLALISGKVVRPGDSIAGYRVVRVGKAGVSLVNPAGSRLELKLGATAAGSPGS